MKIKISNNWSTIHILTNQICLVIQQIFIIHYVFKFQITPKVEKPINFMNNIGGDKNIVEVFESIERI